MAPDKKNTYLTICFAVSALLSVTFLMIVFVVVPQIIYESIESNVQLLDNTIQYDRFLELPIPFHFKIYFFTITNPREVSLGDIPNVQQVGPYVYTESRIKNITSKGTDILTYSERWNFEFNVEESKGLFEDDEISVINVGMIAVLHALEDLPIKLPIDIETLLSQMFEDTNIFITVKVRDYAFDGIRMCDPERMTNFWASIVCVVIMAMNQKVLKYEEDGLILISILSYKQNDDGPFTLKRGIVEIDKLGLLTSLKGQEYTQFWNRSSKTSCDHVNGHAALFPPFMKKNSSYNIYTTDICKTGTLNYVRSNIYRDIEVYRFETHAKSFASPEEDCVCIKQTKDIDGKANCINQGLLDLFTCFGGAPVILSMPHLIFAGEKYQASIRGFDTYNAIEKYNTFLEFEPHLGIPLRAELRIQFNTVLRPFSYGGKFVPRIANISRSVFPLLWVEDGFEMTDELIEELNEKLIGPLGLAAILKWTLIGFTIIIMLLSTLLIVCCKYRGKAYKTT